MKILGSRTAALLASAAALSMLATPALADGWGGGYGGGWGHREHHDDTGAWVVGGIIGIGMIAAIASAASKSNRDRQARGSDGDYRNDGYHSGDNQGGYQDRDYDRDYGRSSGSNDGYGGSYSGNGRNIDGAVDACVNQVERGSTQVDTVDSVGRDGDGWRVTGRVSGGRNFDCAVDGSDRIRSATVDGRTVD